jgi:hypothetical protein
MPEAELHESPHKGQRGLRRLFNAFFYSLSGLRLAFRHESAFRQGNRAPPCSFRSRVPFRWAPSSVLL